MPDYLNPGIPDGLRRVRMPVIEATNAALDGYGFLVDDPEDCEIEIVRWRPQGWRPVDDDTGDEGGTTEGVFVSEWRGDILYGRNEAVGGHYVLAYATEPSRADETHGRDPDVMLQWHCQLSPGRRPALLPARRQAVSRSAGAARRRRAARSNSCASASTARAASTSIPTSGTRACSRAPARSASSTARAPCTRAFPWIFAREFDCLLEAPLR